MGIVTATAAVVMMVVSIRGGSVSLAEDAGRAQGIRIEGANGGV